MPCLHSASLRCLASAGLALVVFDAVPVAAQPLVSMQKVTLPAAAAATAPVVTPPVTPVPVSMRPRPVREPDLPLSPADQFAAALGERDLTKFTALLTADPTLAKTLSSNGTPPLVAALRNFYGYDNNNKQILEKLIDAGADVNAADRGGTLRCRLC